MIDHNERAAEARALRQAAADARAMHDPTAPDCEEWAAWLDARAGRVERTLPTTGGTPPDSPEANARARAEGQTIAFEPSVQPPTREQIDRDRLILTIRDVSADHHGNGRLSLSGPEAARIADAVLALFLPQPSTGNELCGRRAWPHEEYQDEDDACVCLLDSRHEGLHQCGAGCGVEFAGGLPAEPVSIADMEQGVLDQISASRSAPLAPALRPNPGWYKRSPVTPPPATPEEGDRG
jgi:hypothetical protein